jgi:hypothetical protein
MNKILAVNIVIEFSAASWTVGGTREQARAWYGKAATRADACEFVVQERDERDRGHSNVQHFSSLGQRVREANKEERGARDQDEVPLFLALVGGAPGKNPEPYAEGDPNRSEDREEVVWTHRLPLTHPS